MPWKHETWEYLFGRSNEGPTAEERRELAHGGELRAREVPQVGPLAVGQRAPVVAGHRRDELPLAVGEAGHVGVRDQVEGVLVVLVEGDGHAHVVEERGRLQQVPRGRGQAVQRGQVLEQRRGEGAHLDPVALVGRYGADVVRWLGAELAALYSHNTGPVIVLWLNAAMLLAWLPYRSVKRPDWRYWLAGQLIG